MIYENYGNGVIIPKAEDSDLIGYSMSNCVRDIVEGWVDIDNVALIKAGTCVSGNWDELIENYSQYCWGECKEIYEAVLGELISEDKIFQSRLYGLMHGGIWNTWDCLWRLNDNFGVSSHETRAKINKERK